MSTRVLHRRRHVVVLGLLISGFFLWLALRDASFSEVASAFGTANMVLALPIAGILGIYYWLKAIRWSRLLRPIADVSATKCMPAMMVGLAANNLLPAHLGEFVRMYLLARKERLPNSSVLATLVLERFFDIVSILVLVAVVTTGSDLSSEVNAAGLFLLALAVVLMGAMLFLVTARTMFLRVVTGILQPVSTKIKDKIVRQLGLAAEGLEAIRSWRAYPALFINSAAQWLLMASAIAISIHAFGIDVPFSSSVLVLGLIVAGITLPSSPGFFGTVEFCFVLGLSAYGVDASAALSAAVFYHALTWGIATGTGLYFLKSSGLRFREIVAEEKRA